MIKWIKENRQTFDKVTFIGMISKDIEFDTWLLNMESPRTIGDEFALYALCKLFNRHAHVLTRGNTWHTISVEGTYGEKHVEDVCDIHLLFLAKDTIAELKRRTTGVSEPPDETPNMPLIVKPLGLHTWTCLKWKSRNSQTKHVHQLVVEQPTQKCRPLTRVIMLPH